MIDEDFSQILRNNAAITALVGIRIFPIIAPSVEQDFIVYQEVIHGRSVSIDNELGSEKALFQVSIYSKSYSSVSVLASTIVDQLHMKGNTDYTHNIQLMRVDGERSGFERETKLYFKSLDFSIFFN